jgi:small subunit ribosomal protein S19
MARSIKKGPYIAPSLAKKIERLKTGVKRDVLQTRKRSSVVTPELVGSTVGIHNGKKFISVYITENMVGHALGEFSPTRTFKLHSGQRKTGAQPSNS